MLRREVVIGIVSSWDIRWKDSEGYSLLVTDSRLVGAPMPAQADEYRVFFPPQKEREPATIQEAEKKAREILITKNFELQRDKMVKILYEAPEMLLGGRLVFGIVGRRIQIDITVVSGWNPGIMSTLSTLLSSLLVFAPDAFYDELTGSRIRDEAALLKWTNLC